MPDRRNQQIHLTQVIRIQALNTQSYLQQQDIKALAHSTKLHSFIIVFRMSFHRRHGDKVLLRIS